MAQWFRNIFVSRGEAARRGAGGWQILVGRDIRLLVPPGLPNETKWEAWGRIQVRLLSLIQEHWTESHSYIRFNAFPPGYFADKLLGCPYETITNKREEIFLIPECKDVSVMETIFSVLGMISFTRCLFMLDHQPANWKEVMENLFEATKKMSKGQPVTIYDHELSMCQCLCYSRNEELVIGKIDMPQDDVISILKDVSREERIELSVKRR